MFRQPREGLGRYLDKAIVTLHRSLPEYITNRNNSINYRREIRKVSSISKDYKEKIEELTQSRSRAIQLARKTACRAHSLETQLQDEREQRYDLVEEEVERQKTGLGKDWREMLDNLNALSIEFVARRERIHKEELTAALSRAEEAETQLSRTQLGMTRRDNAIRNLTNQGGVIPVLTWIETIPPLLERKYAYLDSNFKPLYLSPGFKETYQTIDPKTLRIEQLSCKMGERKKQGQETEFLVGDKKYKAITVTRLFGEYGVIIEFEPKHVTFMNKVKDLIPGHHPKADLLDDISGLNLGFSN